MRKFILLVSFGLCATFAGTFSASAEWALAIGQENGSAWASGTAWNYPSQRAAAYHAMENCAERGSNCEVVAHGSGGCVAVAFGTEDNAYGWAQRDSKREAVREAMRGCENQSSDSCRIRGTFCDY